MKNKHNTRQTETAIEKPYRSRNSRLGWLFVAGCSFGQASYATQAMELGCDGVLINTAIAKAKNPYKMAEAMKYAVISGRKSYLSGRINPNLFGSASTTNSGII